MRKLNIETIKEKILESSVTRENIFALLESVIPPKTLEEVYSKNNSSLLRYVKDEDIDISEFPYDGLFHDWMYDHDEEALRAFEDEHSWDDYQEVEKAFPEEIKQFISDLKNGKYNNDPDVAGKTKLHMSLQNKKLLPRTTWLVHFSNNADDIVLQGFEIGAEDMTDIALTKFDRGKKYPGYNFAFIADSRYANRAAASPYGRRDGSGKYGEDAVMFMNSGVHFYHYGDEEDQIVFYGPEANDFILLKYVDGKYNVEGNRNYKGHDYIFSPNEDSNSFEQCVNWVKQNWQQYKNVLIWHVNKTKKNITESVEINNKTTAFHVTFSKNIKGILAQGLSKRMESNFYKIENAYQGVFFSTCEDDISYWFSKFEELAANNSDDYVKASLVPVVLKFDVQGQFEIDKIARDEDHRFCSYYSDVTIPSNQISFYYNGWHNLSEFKNEMILKAVDEDGYFLRNSQNPFYPSNNILTEAITIKIIENEED